MNDTIYRKSITLLDGPNRRIVLPADKSVIEAVVAHNILLHQETEETVLMRLYRNDIDWSDPRSLICTVGISGEEVVRFYAHGNLIDRDLLNRRGIKVNRRLASEVTK